MPCAVWVRDDVASTSRGTMNVFHSTTRRLFSFGRPFIFATRRFHGRNGWRVARQKKVAFCIESSLEGAALDNIAVGSSGDRKESREIPCRRQ